MLKGGLIELGNCNITGAFSTDTTISTPVAINKGGTGQTTAQAAIDALTAVSGASTNEVLTKDGSGNAAWSAAAGGATLTSQTFSQTAAETTTSTSYVATNFTLTLPTRSGGYGIVTTNFTNKNSGANLNYFALYDDDATIDVYTSTSGGNDIPNFANHIFSLDGSVIKLYMKVDTGTCTLIFGSGAVEGEMQSLEIS